MKIFKSAKAALEHIKIISNKSIRNEICGFLGYCTQSNQFVVKETKNEQKILHLHEQSNTNNMVSNNFINNNIRKIN